MDREDYQVLAVTRHPVLGNGVILRIAKAPSGFDRMNPYESFGLMPEDAIALGRKLIHAGEEVFKFNQCVKELSNESDSASS